MSICTSLGIRNCLPKWSIIVTCISGFFSGFVFISFSSFPVFQSSSFPVTSFPVFQFSFFFSFFQYMLQAHYFKQLKSQLMNHTLWESPQYFKTSGSNGKGLIVSLEKRLLALGQMDIEGNGTLPMNWYFKTQSFTNLYLKL